MIRLIIIALIIIAIGLVAYGFWRRQRQTTASQDDPFIMICLIFIFITVICSFIYWGFYDESDTAYQQQYHQAYRHNIT